MARRVVNSQRAAARRAFEDAGLRRAGSRRTAAPAGEVGEAGYRADAVGRALVPDSRRDRDHLVTTARKPRAAEREAAAILHPEAAALFAAAARLRTARNRALRQEEWVYTHGLR